MFGETSNTYLFIRKVLVRSTVHEAMQHRNHMPHTLIDVFLTKLAVWQLCSDVPRSLISDTDGCPLRLQRNSHCPVQPISCQSQRANPLVRGSGGTIE